MQDFTGKWLNEHNKFVEIQIVNILIALKATAAATTKTTKKQSPDQIIFSPVSNSKPEILSHRNPINTLLKQS